MKTKFYIHVTASFLLLFNVSFAQIFPDSIQQVAWKSFRQTHPANWIIRWDEKTGVPASIYLGKTKPYSGNPLQIAQTFLKENAAITKMRSDLSNLKLVRILKHRDISHVTFQETYNGIPVEGAEYQVHIESDGSVDMMNGTYYPTITAPTTAQVTEDAALATAQNDVGKNAIISMVTNNVLVILPDNNSFHLAWKVSFGTQQPYGAWTYFVDAISSKILSKSNDICFVTGQGNIYPTNPNLSSVTNIPLYRLDGSELLRGSYANILNNVSNRAYSPNNIFNYSSTDTHFDEVNLYYHIDQYRGVYFANLGFTAIEQITATAHVNYYPGPNNAWFDPSTGQLYFGDGTPSQGIYDFAKEDKIIYHEYTHAVTHSVVNIGSSYDETGAINEGNSDYFAGSYTGRSVIGDYVAPNNFPRDMSNPRIQNYADYNNPNYYIYNGTNYGYHEPHFGGELWSASLWDLHNNSSIGANTTDLLVYGGLHRITSNATFLSYREAIIAEDQATYAGAHVGTIMNIMAARGIGQPANPPRIAYFYQDPDPLYNGGTGYVYAHLSRGTGPITYSWYASYSPSEMTFHFTPQGNMCQVDYYIPYNTLPTINLTCVASNPYGSDALGYQLHCALYPYSYSASLAFETNGELTDENPILVSSSDNLGVDVTDYYLINEKIIPENNTIKFLIHEAEEIKGHTSLDQVELWEVKANKNEFTAVTEEGELISYKKLEAPNQIILNDSLDLTSILADRDELKIAVKKGDRIKIMQPENTTHGKEELYSIFYAQVYYKEEAGLSTDNNNTNNLDKYYFRPQPSSICKKIKVDPAEGKEIEFTEDLIIDYFALVRNEKTAKLEKLKLLEAVHKEKGDVRELLTGIDARYNEIYPGEKVNFTFESKNNSDEKIAYILKTVGRYEENSLGKKNNGSNAVGKDITVIQNETKLIGNYPNPFNPSTQIKYTLIEDGFVTLRVFDILGRQIALLVNEYKKAGSHTINFDAGNLSSGIYFYSISTKDFNLVRKMILVR